MPTEPSVSWPPFERAAYRLEDSLSEEDRRAISTAHGRTLYQQRRPIPPLLQPLVDIARRSGSSGRASAVTGPALYYDLGELYCTNPFWSNCPHRIDCIGCDFNLPKASARGLALESKASVRRYLEEVPLTSDEQAIAEGDLDKLERFIRKKAALPPPGSQKT
ncbi:hypothetical protein [Enterobacter asburiae]|uniref:hypothetical protein n=1 Tax=Enterobacter asburiae TaxID=61645 RepID=UPI001E5C50EA|nr:hypothetical protein [Enterobacter asburiae]MCE2004222.1 hypothetical protein [Enterobacter asburiae]